MPTLLIVLQQAVSLLLLLFFTGYGMALPVGSQIVGGEGQLQSRGPSLEIVQTSPRLLIHHDSFSIAPGERVHFIQPDISSVALNRVTGHQVSQIFGQIQANGQVFLVNPQGIVFAPGSQVNVGGLFATTLDIEDDNFLAGDWQFAKSVGQPGVVRNEGVLASAPGGYVALVASQVQNLGTIQAPSGHGALVSADRVLLQASHSSFAIETDLASWQGVVENHGVIETPGGQVWMEANTAGRLYETVVNNTGIVRATRVENTGGEIYLVGHQEGDIWQTGILDVSGQTAGEEGNPAGSAGTIAMSGQRIAVSGSVLANGSEHGQGGSIDMAADETAVLLPDARVSADGGSWGHGGTVRLFSPDTAIFQSDAHISARGGSLGGDGGFVDVSGWQQVDVAGQVDTSAAFGNPGSFLIDPWDVTIGNTNAGGSLSAPDPRIWTPSASGSTIDVTTINNALQTSSVTIQTSGGGGSEPGTITVASPIDLDGGNGRTLRLLADTDIIINADIRDFNTATAESTHIDLVASGIINVTPGSLIDAGGGLLSLTATGGMNISGLRTTSASASAVTLNANGAITGNGSATDIYAPNGGINVVGAFSGIGLMDTEVASINLGTAAANFSFNEVDDVSLSGGNNLTTLSLTAGGTVTVPDAGLVVPGNLLLTVGDIVDSDRTVTLNGSVLGLSTGLAGGDSLINTTASTATLWKTGSNWLRLFKTDAGNLSLTNQDTNTGSLEINLASGNLLLQDTGLATAGTLMLTASDILDSDRTVTLTGSALDIDTGLAGGDSQINTTASTATLWKTGNNWLRLFKTDAGNLTITTRETNLGSLELNLANGTLIVPDNGLETAGSMTVTANHVQDADNDIKLVAVNGNLDLAFTNNETTPLLINTGLGSRVSLQASVSTKDLTLWNSSGNLRVTAQPTSWNGNLTLSAPTGFLQLPDSGVAASGTLTLSAQDIRDTLDRSVIVNAPSVDVYTEMTGGDNVFNSTATNLVLNTLSTSLATWNKTDAGNLSVSTLGISSGSVAFDLTNGDLVLPLSLSIPQAFTARANTITLNAITAADATLKWLSPTAPVSLATTIGRGDFSIAGQSLSITESNGLVLEDLDGDGFSLLANNGNATIDIAAGNLAINDDVFASDTLANGIRTGLLDFSVNGGDVSVGTVSPVAITSQNLVDMVSGGGLGILPGTETVIRFRQLDSNDQNAQFVFGDASGSDVSITAIGGDLYMDSVGGAVLSVGNARDLLVESDVTIEAYNNPADAPDGVITSQGITNNGVLLARTGRAIQLNGQPTVQPPPAPPANTGNTLEEAILEEAAEDSGKSIDAPRTVTDAMEPAGQPTEADALFHEVFGGCEEDERHRRPSCGTLLALKRFMGSLLLGGELP